MFESPGVPRSHYQTLFRSLLELPAEQLKKSQQAADSVAPQGSPTGSVAELAIESFFPANEPTARALSSH